MITLVSTENEVIQNYMHSQAKNIFAVRIQSLIIAYGKYDNLLDIWYQNDNNKITAYLLKYGNEIIADIVGECDIAELINFCRMTGAKVLLCKKIPTDGYLGTVMKLKSLRNDEYDYAVSHEVDLQEYYRLLKSNQSQKFVVPDFKDFYVDLHHRLRKRCAEITGVYFERQLVSGCIASAISGNSAIISAVATLPEYKRQGFGTKAVYELCQSLSNKSVDNIYLQRDKNENKKFYRHSGFEDVAEFMQILL